MKYDIDSAGSDWFFLNDYGKPADTPEKEKHYYQFVEQTLAAGAQVNFCLPITPWIAKPRPGDHQRYCSFPTSLYPDQQKTDGQGCGNGLKPDGEPIWGNDPSLGMTHNSPELQGELVRTL